MRIQIKIVCSEYNQINILHVNCQEKMSDDSYEYNESQGDNESQNNNSLYDEQNEHQIDDENHSYQQYSYNYTIVSVHNRSQESEGNEELSQQQSGEASHISYLCSQDFPQSYELEFRVYQQPSVNQSESEQENVQENPQGLDPQQIQTLPRMIWTQICYQQGKEQICSICHEAYEINDDLRVLNCFHRFHTKCVDFWLVQKNNCPHCRQDVVFQ